MQTSYSERVVEIPAKAVLLEGALAIPKQAQGLVIFAHGSGSSRFSPRNNFVAHLLRQADIATLLIDLLTREEDERYQTRFDIDLLTDRLLLVAAWLQKQPLTQKLTPGYFGASTGAAAALKAAAGDTSIRAIVSRGGRPDLAAEDIARVQSPTLLIVGGNDRLVLKLNRQALAHLKGTKQLVVIPGATHLFEEPGALEKVADLATQWFKRYLH